MSKRILIKAEIICKANNCLMRGEYGRCYLTRYVIADCYKAYSKLMKPNELEHNLTQERLNLARRLGL